MKHLALVVWLAAVVFAPAQAQQPPCAYSFGLVARTKIDLNGNDLYADSFDSTDLTKSTDGRYDSSKKQAEGNVAVGESITNSVADSGNANIYGFIFTGPSGTATIGANGTVGPTFSSPATNVSDAVVNGWIRNDCFQNVTDVVPPSGAASWSSLGNINNTTTINGGDWRLSGISLVANKILTIQGNVRLFITGSTSVTGNGSIVISSNASLTVYSAGNILLAGNGVQNDSGLALKDQWFGLPTCISVSIAGNGVWIGTVCTPEASLSVSGDVFGAVVANGIILGGTGNLHYDEALNVKVCSGAAIDDSITGVELAGGHARVRFPVAFFKSYTVEYRDDLETGDWVSLTTTNTASCTGEVVEVIDPGAGSRSQRLYRLRVQSPGLGF